jgi:predicted O-methyltransferase YrrM
MNPIQIGRKRLSEIVWGIIDEKVGDFPFEIIEKIVEEQQSLRFKAEYNTGSLPYDDAIELYKVVNFFKPAVVAEVGTFIGVSTRVMNLASNGMVVIYTCDISNDINLDTPNIHQYPKTASPDMFKALTEKDWKVDLVYLDGRLGQDDIEPLNKIVHDKTVFVLDDFEGTEKGVVNAAISLPFTMLQVVPQEAT